ncbi:MAG TPA: ribonuclease P protein component [Coriobacteriia bacterium]
METVKSSREIERMFAEGKRAAHPILIALVTETPDERGHDGRVVFIAGKKLGGAVVRNRAKRLLREAVRRVGGPWKARDVALLARPALLGGTPEEIDAALSSVLERSGVER